MTGCFVTSSTISNASLTSSSVIGFHVRSGFESVARPSLTWREEVSEAADRANAAANQCDLILIAKANDAGERLLGRQLDERLELQAAHKLEVDRLNLVRPVHARFDDGKHR